MRHAQHLGDAAAYRQNRHALTRKLLDKIVNLVFRADADTCGRLVDEYRAQLTRELFVKNRLLAVAVGEIAYLHGGVWRTKNHEFYFTLASSTR